MVWQEGAQQVSDITGARVSLDGAVLSPEPIFISQAPNAQSLPAVDSDGKDFLIIWADRRNNVTTNIPTYRGDIYGARLDSDGNLLDPDGFLISTQAFVASPSIASRGTEMLALWDNRIPLVPSPTTEVRAAVIEPGANVVLTDLIVNTNGAYPTLAVGSSDALLVVSTAMGHGASRILGSLVQLTRRPFIGSLSLTGSVAILSWRAEPGRTYRVQFKPDLRNVDWQPLDPLVLATNSEASFQDDSAGNDRQRFYRVLQLP